MKLHILVSFISDEVFILKIFTFSMVLLKILGVLLLRWHELLDLFCHEKKHFLKVENLIIVPYKTCQVCLSRAVVSMGSKEPRDF